MPHFAEVPNLRHLRMVQVIGRTGGVSCASRALSTSQPAVTQAVANLEAEIGTPVFERCATGTYPTAIGAQFLRRIDRFFDILDRAVVQAMPRQDSGAHRAAPPIDRLITGTQLRALIVTSEHERISEIAQTLGLSPASLLRSARSLERTFGKPLFDRTANGPIANRTGSFLAREFRRALREIELARGEILLAGGAENLEVVIGALPMAGSHELAIATHRFMAAYPHVKVRLISGEYHKLLADLSNSRIDMIFGILRRPDWADDIAEELLFQDSYCVVARPGHPLVRQAEVSADDLSRFDWVVPSVGTPRRERIEEIFNATARRPRFNLVTPSLTMCRALLLNSETVTLMTRSEVQSDLDLGILVDLRCTFMRKWLNKGVSTRADWMPTEAHAAFLDCLRAATSAAAQDRGHGIAPLRAAG